MKTFFRELVWIMCLVLGIVFGTQAQQVPGAIKYQAVLRDVNGKTLANKENVNLRISLRLDDPTTGQIAYSEEHKGITTNAYGVINLEIGGGTVTSGKDLHEVPWAQHDIYVQIEIETDGTGYTHMGNAELLTVPYAFYAENTGTDKLYENLDDNVLPKYNAANKTLANSGVSQQGRALEVDASSITFINKADANMQGYKFPMTVGRQGQVLGFKDNAGTLDWVKVEGGGGGGGVSLDLQGDGHLVYWNDTKGELDTVSGLRYDYKGSRKLELNTDITGINNVLLSDKLGDGQIWVGNNFSNRLAPVNMSGAVSMDKTGNTTLNLDGHVVMTTDNKTRLNLAMKGGIKLIPGRNGARDTLAVDNAGSGEGGASGSGESLWETSEAADGYLRLFPKGDDSHDRDNVYVGVGHNNPIALFHVMGHASMLNPRALFSECDVEFASATNSITGYTPSFQWFKDKAALFIGATSPDNFMPTLGSYSFAFGADASAAPNHTFALGREASVAATATDAFAIGNYSKVQGVGAMALGNGAEASGSKSVALGDHAVASGNNSVVLGHSQSAGSNAVVVGYGNEGKSSTPIQDAVIIGKSNAGNHSGSVVLGNDNTMSSNSILIGKSIPNVPDKSLIVGSIGQVRNSFSGATVFGHIVHTSGDISNTISIGQVNSYGSPSSGSPVFGNSIMLGTNLANYGTPDLTMIGDSYSDEDIMDLGINNPKFLYGFNMNALFGVDGIGNIYARKDVFAEGINISSDERLKTDIKPMLCTPDFLDLITPVSYTFKSDKQQKTRFGFIAQEVRNVFPELVLEGKNGMLRLDYIGLVPVLWQINQNLSHKVNDLEQRLEEQSRKQAELESELQAIKAKLGM